MRKEEDTSKQFSAAFCDLSHSLMACEDIMLELLKQAETVGEGRVADKLEETQARLEESERQLSKVRGERNAAIRQLNTLKTLVSNVVFRKANKVVQKKSYKKLSEIIGEVSR